MEYVEYLFTLAALASLVVQYWPSIKRTLVQLDQLLESLPVYDPHGILEFAESLGYENRVQARAAETKKMTIKDFADKEQIIGNPSDDKQLKNDLGEKKADESQLLGVKKLKEIRRLLCQFAELPNPLSPEIKAKLSTFKTAYEQYDRLRKKLRTVQTALRNNDATQIDDDLMMMQVSKPILLVKQYQKDGKWHAVPAMSYVTDKDFIVKWLIIQPIHPLVKDSFLHSKTYKNMPTQYVWHVLTKDYCMAQELMETALSLRTQLNELQAALKDIGAQKNTVSSFKQTLFNKEEHQLLVIEKSPDNSIDKTMTQNISCTL